MSRTHHRLADRVKAHVFRCMLGDDVRWHMERVWASLALEDEDGEPSLDRDSVAPAQRSQAAPSRPRPAP